MTKKKYLKGLAYVLGTRERRYRSIEGISDILRANQLPLLPDLLGLGSFFVTEDPFEEATAAVGRTLAAAGLAPNSIEHVIVCSSDSTDRFSERNRKSASLLHKSQIAPIVTRGVTGTGCVNLISAIDLASAAVDLGNAKNVLVVAVEGAVFSDAGRVLNYALLSDAAVSFVVSDADSSSDPNLFEILATRVESCMSEVGRGMSITKTSPDREFVKRTLEVAGSTMDRVSKVFGNNIFLPMKTGREGLIGFNRSQMYLENVSRKGHCLGCDSVINLLDHGVSEPGAEHVLYAEAEGHFGCVVLKQCQPTSVC